LFKRHTVAATGVRNSADAQEGGLARNSTDKKALGRLKHNGEAECDMASAPMPSKPVVLVVEDEPFILADVVTMLRDAGFDVIEATSADEAIDILTARSDIRVVFTDIEMPGSMDGLKLARVVREKWPPVELIVTSGKRNLRDTDLPARGRFIEKPYSARQVTDAIRSFVG
jgi:CheY-like chemotaxis protein